MKKWWLCLPLLLMLCSCGGKTDFETMSDQYFVPDAPEPAQVNIQLPENAAVMTMENGSGGTLYLCDGYAVAVQVLEAGDLDATLRTVTGYGRDDLQLYTVQSGGVSRCACVWACAGEGGDQVGKAVILDDGNYHYAVTVMADYTEAGHLQDTWKSILNSVTLNTD